MKMTYFVEKIRSTEKDWLIDHVHLESVQAADLEDAKNQIRNMYGSYIKYKRLNRKNKEHAGVFYV